MFYKLIDRPVSVLAILIMLTVPGIMVARLFPVSLLPDIESPLISVRVNSPGMSATEINSMLIAPLSQQFARISDLEEMECRSVNGSGIVSLRFALGSSRGNWKYIEVNERIDMAMSGWPSHVERPLVARSSVSDIPSYFINVTCSDSWNFAGMSNLVRDVIIHRIEQLGTVAMADVSGLAESQLAIIPDRGKMMSLGISDDMLVNAISDAGLNVGSVMVKENGLIYEISFEPSLIESADVSDVWLNVAGRLLRISDLVTVTEQGVPGTGIVMSDGRDAVSMAIIKNRDCSMGELRRDMDRLLESMKEDYPFLTFTVTRDQTALLDYSIAGMVKNLVYGVLFACLVLFFFYRDLRSPLMILLSVPVSLAISSLILYAAGVSVNIISLSGLVLGIGMMVDNSIISIGNISRRYRKGESLRTACVEGTREVFTPLLSSMLTTCSMFLPLAFLSGTAGTLFLDESLSVSATLFSSLAVSVLAIPLLYYLIGSKKKPAEASQGNRTGERIYLLVMNKLIRHRWGMWGIMVFLDFLVLYVAPHIPKRKLPEITRTETMLSIDWKRPAQARETADLCQRICSASMADHYTVMSGPQGFVLSHTPVISGQNTLISLKCSSEEALNSSVAYVVNALSEEWPGLSVRVLPSENVLDMLFPDSESDVILHLTPVSSEGDLVMKADALISRLKERFPNAGVEKMKASPELVLEADQDMLARYGLTMGDLVSSVMARLENHPFMRLERGHSSVPVIIAESHEESFLEFVTSGVMRGPGGTAVPVSELVDLKWRQVPHEIFSGIEGDYIPVGMTLQGNIERQLDDIRRIVAEDGNFETGFAGSYFSGTSLFMELLLVLGVSIMLLYLILAAQFSSLVQPLIILGETIVDIGFVLVVLWVSGESLNVMSMTGIVVMCGIVINDSILKVDTINRLLESGHGLLRAVLEAGHMRNGAIIMTSVTTILAMVPFLVRGDMGSDLQFPLSLTIISGMVIGTLVSIFLVPVACYSWLHKKQASGTSQLRSSLNKI